MDGGSGGFAGLLRRGGERLLERSASWQKCGSIEVWQSGSGNDAWFLPSTEEVTEIEIAWSWADGVGDCVEAVDNCVGWCDSWDGEVVMTHQRCGGT